MIVRSPCDVSTIFRRVYIGYHQLFVSFQYLSSDDVYNTTTQSDSIANGVKTEPGEEQTVWVKPWLLRRFSLGHYDTLMQELM